MAEISAFLESGLRVTISSDRHTWYADEPVSAGGEDSGPTPYEMLLGSLAACTALTLRLYADRKQIPLTWVKAVYEFDRVHMEDCEQCEEADTGMIDRIQTAVSLSGTFTEEQRERLEQVVSRCPVHKTLTHGMQIFDRVTFINGNSTGLD